MIFIIKDLNSSTRDFMLNIVATFHWDELIFFSVEDIDITIEVVTDRVQVPFELAAGATNDVV